MDKATTANVVFLLTIACLLAVSMLKVHGKRGYIITSAFSAFIAILSAYQHFWPLMGLAAVGSACYLAAAVIPWNTR